MLKKGTIAFIIVAGLWQIAVGIIYGLFFSYDETSLTSMEKGTSVYNFASTSGASTKFLANTTQYPFPLAVIAIAMILLIVGFAMVAGYIQRSSVTGMAFTLLIFALTVQNFFIFRNFWNRIGLNSPNVGTSFNSSSYSHINYINFGNDLQKGYQLTSASWLDAIGASLAMYAGYTAVIGRIGLGEIFFLTWIGTFIYEINAQLLNRFFIPDNGYPSRAFAYGGILGLVSSLVLGKRDITVNSTFFRSSYKIMALAFLGIIFVWCSYPILVLSSTYTSAQGKIVAMAGQVNIWLALATSVLGCFTASAFSYRKFCVHDMVFASITGAIAFSSSTDINYNPGAATAIGFTVGFLSSLSQTRLKRKINEAGVIDSNSVIFQFILPSFFAAIASSVLQGIGQSATSATTTAFNSTSSSNYTQTNVTYTDYKETNREYAVQGGFQMAGWALSIGFGAAAGLIIGLIYKALNDNFQQLNDFFNDATLYQYKGKQQDVYKQREPQDARQKDPKQIN